MNAFRPLVTVTALTASSAGAVTAQSIDLLGEPVRVQSLNASRLGPIIVATPDGGGRWLIVGGGSREELFLLDSLGRSAVKPVRLSDVGPALAMPVAAAFINQHRVAIVDGQGPQLALVDGRDGVWRKSVVVDSDLSRVSGACAAGGRVFVMAKLGTKQAAGIVHEVDPRGAIVRSFGAPFTKEENPAVAYGRIACSEDAHSVFVVARLGSEVRAYGAVDGQLRWSVPLTSFKPVRFRTSGRRHLFDYPPDSVWDENVSVFVPAPSVVVIQVARWRGLPGRATLLGRRTILVSQKSGTILREQANLPHFIGAGAGKLAGVDRNDAFLLYSYRFREQ